MKSRTFVKKLAALAVTVGALSGCGLSANAPASPTLVAPAAEWSHPAFEVLVEGSEPKKAHAEFMAKLALTAEQKTQIKTAMRHALERMKPIREKMKPLVTGETVDKAALSTAVTELMKVDAQQDAQTMAEIRAILTEAQRKLIADKLVAMSSSTKDPHTKMFERLMKQASEQVKLTEAQRESYAKMKADFLGFWEANRAAYYQQMASFMWHGKTDMLQREFEQLHAKWPTGSTVDFMAGLDQSQRQALVAWKEQWLAKIASKLD